MSITGGLAARRDDAIRRLVLGVLLPLAILALAYAEWWISDTAGYIGPFDKAQFGWAVVVPTWLAGGAVAAFLWSRLSSTHARWAAAAVMATVAPIAGWLLWQAAMRGDAGCEFGAAYSPLVRGIQSLAAGVLIGLDPVVAGLVGRRAAARGPAIRVITVAAVVGFALIWVAILGSFAIAGGVSCNRPTPGLR